VHAPGKNYQGRLRCMSPVTFNSGAILAADRNNAPICYIATLPLGIFLLVVDSLLIVALDCLVRSILWSVLLTRTCLLAAARGLYMSHL
jgi:hypothetical protein